MGLRSFAERVLFGTDLSDKLRPADGLDDQAPGAAISRPDAPGRPLNLPLRTRERPRFPAAERLGDVEHAATALHAFANHELLAVELMALALLRFPDGDPAWRREVAITLQEEQAHLQLYLDRLDQLGVPFGQHALSAYFWDALSGVDSPRSFCAGMGMTLEQANLDFAGHFADAFATVGDTDTEALLRRVLAEEVVHVARGLRWFDRLSPGVDRWAEWVDALPSSLTPRRARGPDFAVAPRLRAGLDDDFVQRIRTFGASRGRPSNVHWLNRPGEVEDGARARAWVRDLEATALLLASDDDVVLLQQRPGRLWLARLAEAGFALPAIADLLPDGPRWDGAVGSLRPWCRTDEAAAALAAWGGVDVAFEADKVADGDQLAALLGDLGPADRLLNPSALPRVASTAEEAVDIAQAYRAAGFERVVFKRPLGTAGRGQLRWFEDRVLPQQRGWLDSSCAAGPIRVEPWLDRVLDLSFQLDVGGLRGIVRFQADGNGRFRGASLERPTVGLSPDLARFCAGDGRDPRWIEGVGRRLADALEVDGPTGIDAFVYRDGEGLRLHPFVERNPRYTFGRLALDLRARLAPGAVGVWTLMGRSELRRSGAKSFADLAERLDLLFPLVRRRGQLQQVALPTSDPETADTVLPMLLVAPDRATLDQALAARWPVGEA